MATTEIGRPDALLTLPGSGSAEARLEVIYQPRATRLSRALLVLGVALAAMPVVFFLPPHFLWPLLTLGIGLYLARRYWKGEYYVVEFEGDCPRCGTTLELKEGARIGAKQTLECYGCHRQPELTVRDPETGAGGEAGEG